MPYNRTSLYLTFGGPYFQTEQWQTGVHFASPESTTFETLLPNGIDPDTIKTALETFIGAPYAMWSDRSPITWHRLAVIGQDGLYIGEPVVEEYVPALTSSATTQLPPQVAWVGSMWSGGTVGRANYGRMYFPVPATAVPSNGLLPTELQDGARAAFAQLLDNLTGAVQAAAGGTGLVPCIMSKEGAGTTKAVAKIGVGRVLDTQRRRRNALQESINWADAWV